MRDVIEKLNKYAKKPGAEIVRKLDRVMSTIVRTDSRWIAFMDAGCPMVRCFTCGRVYPWTKLDCGHYIPRHRQATRWDLRNIRPQCTQCNLYHEGEHWIFRKRLVDEIGLFDVEDIEHRAELWDLKKMPVWDLEKMLEMYEPVAKHRLKEYKKPSERPGLGLS